MISVGIDLHRKRSHVAVIDAGRPSCSRAGSPTTRDASWSCWASSRTSRNRVGGDLRLGVAGRSAREAGYELHLAHPLRTKAIASARVKTDAVDARTLAQLLRADLLPEAYIAPRELRDLRDLLRHRIALTQMRTALKNRVHALLARHGIQRRHSDLFGQGGREFLAELALRPEPRRRLDSLLSLIGDLDREVASTTQEIDARAEVDDRVGVLCQIRGIGPYTAMLVIAEVGDDRTLPHRPPALRLGRPHPDRSQLRRQGPTRSHLKAGLARPALGARRGRPARRPGQRPAARELRSDRRAPRPQGRQSRRRAQDPHPLLLRPARRRDPLPGAPLPAERGHGHGGRRMIAAATLIRAAGTDAMRFARASSQMSGLQKGRPPALIEPPSSARHSGPRSAAGWMTGTSPPCRLPGWPTPRGP